MLKHFQTTYRSDSDLAYLTKLFFYSPARQWETIDETLKAPHICD